MGFNGFEENDFQTFQIDGLEQRMTAIQERIQPKFQQIGEVLAGDLAILAGNEMHLHIAKHARRTKNPPQDTWLAIAANKRGYKKHPHFQVGLFDDHVFIWLAYIYELPNKQQIATTFLDNIEKIKNTVPDDYLISLDHMKKGAEQKSTLDLEKALTRFRDVKKAEFLIGRHLDKNDPIVQNGDQFLAYAKQTYQTLLPLYRLSM